MTVSIAIEANGLVVGRVSGIFQHSEFETSKKQISQYIQQNGRISVLVLIDPDFSGLEHSVEWQDNHHDEFIQQHVDHLAIVGQPHLAEDAVLFLLGGLVPFPIKYFNADHAGLARAWLLASRDEL